MSATAQQPTQAPVAAPPSAFITALLSVLGAIGTGIGVLGFLTFVGGATWVARFRGVGLSGTYGISVMPRSELIATGADQLLGPAVAAAAAVAIALLGFAVARWWRATEREWTIALVVLVLLGIGFALWYFQLEAGTPWARRVLLAFGGATVVTVVGAAFVVLLGRRAYDPERPVATARVVAFAVVIAVTVLGYGAFERYARTLADPEIRPVALFDPAGQDYAGYYVGQDADTLFVGVIEPPLEHGTNPRSHARIIQVPLVEEARVAIGSSFRARRARNLAQDLLDDLHKMHSP